MKWLKKIRVENQYPQNIDNESLHRSMAFPVILGQCFGIMPVQGVIGPNERSLYFSWKSYKTLYSVLLLSGILFAVYMTLHDLIWNEATIFKITALMFFGSTFTSHILFIILARNWPKLVRDWYIVEVSMRNYGWPPRLNMRIRLMTVVILLIALVEHVLVVTSNLMRSDRCKSSDQGMFEYFFVIISYPQVFSVVEYYLWAGILMQFINFVSTFSWTYIDLFIMLMSSSLSLRFRQITQRVEVYVETRVSDEFMWRNVREDYNRLSKLCKRLNESLSYIVLISFGNNLFFILIQFFNSLRNREDMLEKVYFFFSFGFLIGRTVCVSLYGAWIHDESQKPLPILNTVSSTVYNTEIRRFILHVCFDCVALSGKHFFNVTRGLILSIAGTIVTYELVLIQFYGNLLHDQKKTNATC